MVLISCFKYWMKKQLQDVVEVAEYNLRMQVWKYNYKCFAQ